MSRAGRFAMVAGALLACDPSSDGGGCGQPGVDPNTSSVETGTVANSTLVYSRLDNPNIHFREVLQEVLVEDGTLSAPQEVFATVSPANFKFSKSDFLVPLCANVA